MPRSSESTIINRLLSLSRGQNFTDSITSAEDLLAKRLRQIILNVQADSYYDFEEDEELYLKETVAEEAADVAFEPLSAPANEYFTYEYCCKVLQWKADNPNSSFSRLQHHFRRVKSASYITRFRDYVVAQGTQREKMQSIATHVYERFNKARIDLLSVRDDDIKRWALEKALEIHHTTFKASDRWIQELKCRNRIGSRKITKFTTVSAHTNEETVQNAASARILEVMEFARTNGIGSNAIFNADESGIRYEEHRARTLSYIGEKNTAALIASLNATTHSYTIMPILSMSGKLHPKALICLREPTGAFGPNVRVPDSPNLLIKCSKSGKLDKGLVKLFMTEIYGPMAPEKSILLLDSWSGHKDESNLAVPNKRIKIFLIPEGATSMMQPLDVYAFRQWKDFIKRIQSRIVLDRLPVILHNRETIITMNTLILNQLTSPLFIPMFKFAWSNSGFNVDTTRFEGFKEICFELDHAMCQMSACNNTSFLQCSLPICRKTLCMYCFFEKKHYHNE